MKKDFVCVVVVLSEDGVFRVDPKHKNDTLDFFRRYPDLLTFFLNAYHGLRVLKYDFPFVICGDVGNGKSMLLLHIIELWYRVVLKQRFTPQHIRHVQKTRGDWIQNFKELEPFDINANDEGTNSLMSKESMQKFNITLNKLYNVIRKKFLVTPILIPDFFELPSWFRKRVRCVIEVEKRGIWKLYDKESIKFANAYNMNKPIKTLRRVRPHLSGAFPDYLGVLRDPYDADVSRSVDEILNDLVMENKMDSFKVEDSYYSLVSASIMQGKTQRVICEELRISPKTVSKIRKKMILEGMI